MPADLAAVAWEQLLTDTGAGDLAAAVVAEMPLDVASPAVARLLADRHLLLAIVYGDIAHGLADGTG